MGPTFVLQSETFILNIDLWDQHSTPRSAPFTLCVSSYGFDIQLCIRKHSSEYRAVGWTFISAFNTMLNKCRLRDRHSALHSKIFILNIELYCRPVGLILNSAFQANTHFEYRSKKSTFRFPFGIFLLECRVAESCS